MMLRQKNQQEIKKKPAALHEGRRVFASRL
jgi:hypothetical protein